MVAPPRGGLRRPQAVAPGRLSHVRDHVAHPVSTRKLIVAALLTGLAILVAFALQVTMAAR